MILEAFDEIQEEWESDEEETAEIDDNFVEVEYSEEEIEELKLELDDLIKFRSLAQKIRKNSKAEQLFTALSCSLMRAIT